MKPYRISGLIKLRVALVATVALLSPAAFGATWYVDHEATGAGTGLKWDDAFTTIQPAIDDAFDDGGGEVWVAEGTYTSTFDPVLTMRQNVHVYGGFIGLGTGGEETDISQRDWLANETVIDGEDSRRCVIGTNTATLDGFSIRNGYATGYGGGMYNDSSSPTVTNCLFSGNSSTNGDGAGMYNMISSSPTVIDCTFSDNNGGGILNNINSSPIVTNCTFSNNIDGGMYNNSNSSPTVTSCTFSGNSSDHHGGAMTNDSSSPTVTNCLFYGNTGHYGAVNNTTGSTSDSSSPTIINCTFFGNTADSVGGGILNGYHSSSTVINCILWGDSPTEIYNGHGAYASVVTYSCVQGGYSGQGNIRTSPMFIEPGDENFRLKGGSPCVDAGTLSDAPATDMVGVNRPQVLGVDMGAYEFVLEDLDGDGLPDADEAAQGCDEDFVDAALWATVDYPSNGASFGTTPIQLSGSTSSPYVDTVLISTDGGTQYDKKASISGMAWSYTWTPEGIGTYTAKLIATNAFGGYTVSDPTTVRYSPNSPEGSITSPIGRAHVQGVVMVSGTAAEGNLGGIDEYVLEYVEGDDPDVDTGWRAIVTSSTQVLDDTLGTWDVSGLADGDYVLRLQVTDIGSTSSTHVVVRVDTDFVSPGMPTLTISGDVLSDIVRNGSIVSVEGTCEPGAHVSSATINGQDVAESITVHLNGSIRGSFALDTVTADTVALEMTVADPVGNVSPVGMSNALTVDNDEPTVSITFPPDEACLAYAPVTVTGTAEDVGAAGLQKVEVDDGGDPAGAVGTDAWTYEWTPASPGTYTLTAKATDLLGNDPPDSVIVHYDPAKPSAYISSPSENDVVGGQEVSIVGTAAGSDFDHYVLRYGEGESPSSWITITDAYTAVTDDTLAIWDTDPVRPYGTMTIQLLVFDTSASYSEYRVTIGVYDVQSVIYVDKDNTSNHRDGVSWATAFTKIQEGIDYALVTISPNTQEMHGEVWVAEGVYDEERVSLMHDPPVDTGSLVMGDAVNVYGGFAGTEAARNERDWETHTTIINGSAARAGESSYHVVVGVDNRY